MRRLVQTIALAAALTAIALSVWRDYGLLLALKRAIIAYLSAYLVGAVLVLATRAALGALADPPPPPPPEPQRRKRRRKASPRTETPDPEDAPAAEPSATENAPPDAPEPATSAVGGRT
jgi:hypothetical protein